MLKLLTRDDLERLFRGVGTVLADPVEILLTGGCAVLAWCPDGTATKDIDVAHTEGFVLFSEALARWSRSQGEDLADTNTRSDAFEVFFPENWKDRVCEAPSLCSGNLRVLVPSPADLAVSKVFRFHSKDADDIQRLASIPEFDRERFLAGFLNVLPVAIGNPQMHAHSFTMAWNGLYPGQDLAPEEILDRAGIRQETS